MEEKPTLRTGLASRRKKPEDKLTMEEVDKKALSSIFIDQTEQWGIKWNRFEDPRGWIWIQIQENK